jgi:hypothetical protein
MSEDMSSLIHQSEIDSRREAKESQNLLREPVKEA